MADSNCHASSSFKSPAGKLFSSIFQNNLPISRQPNIVENIALVSSNDRIQFDKFEQDLSSFSATSMPLNNNILIQQESDIDIDKLNLETVPKIDSVQTWKQEYCYKNSSHPSSKICPFGMQSFKPLKLNELRNFEDSLDMQFQFLISKDYESCKKIDNNNKDKVPLIVNCPYYHPSHQYWVDIYLASISSILTQEDYDWLSNSQRSNIKLWNCHEPFSGGGYGYSSTAIKILSTSQKYSLSNVEKLKLFSEKYHQGKEDEALKVFFINCQGLNFNEILNPEITNTNEDHLINEPSIISLAALLLNEHFNHECFQCIQYFILNKFPALKIMESDMPIHSFIAQLIEIVRLPLEGQLFCNIQKCLSFLLIMIGQPLLALDCLHAALKASSNNDLILLSRICALVRISLLNLDGSNPLFQNFSNNDIESIVCVWRVIRPKLQSYINSENDNLFKPAKRNYEMLISIEKELIPQIGKFS